MPILRFETNIPQSLRLIRLEGRTAESKFGGTQMMFMAQEGAFYVSEKVGTILADQFAKLGVKPGDMIEITKAEAGRGPERRTQWIVATAVPAQDATLAVPKLPDPPAPAAPTELEQQLAASIRMVEQRKQPVPAPPAVAYKLQPETVPAWAAYLVQQSNALIDAYSQVLTHASQYPNVRGEDVRSIFLSTFINVSKGQSRVA